MTRNEVDSVLMPLYKEALLLSVDVLDKAFLRPEPKPAREPVLGKQRSRGPSSSHPRTPRGPRVAVMSHSRHRHLFAWPCVAGAQTRTARSCPETRTRSQWTRPSKSWKPRSAEGGRPRATVQVLSADASHAM